MKSLKRHILKKVILLIGISLSSGYEDLSRNKTTSQSTTWSCPTTACKNYYISSNAVDRDEKTCTRNIDIGGSSVYKTVWWKVDLDGIYSIYRISILFKDIPGYEDRQRGRFAGFSLYLSESGNRDNNSLCYKDGPDLPPLNFTTTCTGYGRYVIFYNERLDGVTYPDGYKNSYTELCEVIVKGCNKTSYGRNCNKNCSVNCENQRCNIVDGACLRCKPGWTGNLCDNKCPGGWYGLDCKQRCSSHCINNEVCNHVTGRCDNGCADGWMGINCEEPCKDGNYGPGCIHNCSGNCLHDVPCNKQDGSCDTAGCKPGYTGDLCNTACIAGYYGSQCKEHCSQNCRNDKTCSHIDGVCTSGCKDGYVGERCKQSCQKGYFGRNCSGICSERCIGLCKITDGSCICAPGWRGANCSEECSQSYGKNCQTLCSKFCVNNTCDRFNGSCLAGCNEGAYGDKCDQGIVTASHISNTPSSGTLTAVGVVVPIAIIIVLVVLVILFIRYKRKSSETSAKRKDIMSIKPLSSLEQVNRESLLEQESNLNNADVIPDSSDNDVPNETAMRGRPTNKCMPVINLQAIICTMSATEDAGFKNEYQDIPKGELHPCEEAKRPENKPKNRYKTTFPYDHSRVLLKTSSPSEGDYINANYIEDVQGKPSYIATQGPKPKTIGDFWRMIWQEEVSVIVCLTNLKEGAKNKCAQYWPNINDKLQNGGFNIRNMEEKVYANYTKRLFKVYKHLEQKDREVVMFHYTRWPDHGVPDPLSLVVFHRHVMKTSSQYPGKYFVVHCSAGIGRTGTYIALDALYREGESNGKINVPMYVRTMRKDRMNMIQGDEQYKTVYLVLYESFRGKSRCMTTEQILQEYQGKSCYANCEEVTKDPPLSSDFKELLYLRKTYTEKVYEYGRANISANYTKDVLPVEEFMCRLSYSKGRLTYYNAVFHQSYKENDSLISAQYPLQAYTEDFLRLIKDVNARVVVFLCPLSDLEYSSHWIPSKNMDKTVGSFTIKLTSCETSANVSKTNIILKPKGSSSMKITVLECPKWKEGQSVADIRDLVDVVKEAKTENFGPGSRLITLSSDGATRCGAFLVVYNALEQLSMDQEVDIFTISRQLQIRRPEFLSTLEEYQLSHEALAEYLRNDSVYANC